MIVSYDKIDEIYEKIESKFNHLIIEKLIEKTNNSALFLIKFG